MLCLPRPSAQKSSVSDIKIYSQALEPESSVLLYISKALLLAFTLVVIGLMSSSFALVYLPLLCLRLCLYFMFNPAVI